MNRRSRIDARRGGAGLTTALGCLLALPGCGPEETSRLQERGETKSSSAKSTSAEAGEAAQAETGSTPTPGDESPSSEQPPTLDPEPPEGAELHDIRLRLAEGTDYRALTVGMVKLPAVMKPIGFAREEGLLLTDCKGEGFERSCLLTHSYLNYEAEKPSGGPFEADEKRVDQLVTKHRITAGGKREGATEVSGPAEQADAFAGKELADSHRFYCLRFPEQPIAEGATWPDKCQRRVGGRVASRDVIWTLDSVDDTPQGKRAQLKAAGKYTVTDPATGDVREGTVQSILYYFVDPGEPHSLKEKISLPLAGGGMSTVTTLTVQFAQVDPKDPDKKLLMDGRPYVAPARPPTGSPAENPAPTKGPG